MVKGMWKNSRRMKVLQGLATGRTYTFAEFRDELIENKNERIARSIIQRIGRGGWYPSSVFDVKLECTSETTHKKRIASIRCVNATEVAQLLARSGGSAVTKKPSKKPSAVVTAMPREAAKKSATVSTMTAKTAEASVK